MTGSTAMASKASPKISTRVTDAVLKIVKFDIAVLEKAYRSWAG
jgi:hypothetical protein